MIKKTVYYSKEFDISKKLNEIKDNLELFTLVLKLCLHPLINKVILGNQVETRSIF